MKRIFTALFAMALFAGLALADSANDRFRMKTGRDLPAVEQARARAESAASERDGFFAPLAAAPAHNDAQERAFYKTGRYPAAIEARVTGTPAHNDADERFFLKTGRHPRDL